MTASSVQHADVGAMPRPQLGRIGKTNIQEFLLTALPAELICKIFQYLEWYDHWMLKATCKTLRDIGQQVNPLPLSESRIYEK
jgi:hypothetical protein